MGQHPKSIADHKREGTYREDRHGDRLPEHDFHMFGAPSMPEGLTPRAQTMWNQIVGNISPANRVALDSAALAGLVRWWDVWADAMTEAESSTGKEQWTAICRAGMAWKNCVQLMSKFGMTPADRSKFRKSAPTGPSETNPIAQLMEGVN